VASDADASLEVQTQQVLDKIDAFLVQANSSRSRLVMVTIYLPEIANFEAMNRVYDAWVDPASTPARATVEARLADPRLRVEISAVAEV
jgi:enamine deaminase RidA (YjgF/YER057c/UK114 family)